MDDCYSLTDHLIFFCLDVSLQKNIRITVIVSFDRDLVHILLAIIGSCRKHEYGKGEYRVTHKQCAHRLPIFNSVTLKFGNRPQFSISVGYQLTELISNEFRTTIFGSSSGSG